MRKKLAEISNDERHRFLAEFKRYGTKKNNYNESHSSPTILLVHVKMLDKSSHTLIPVASHIWLNLTQGFKSLGLLKEHEIVSFDGRIEPYMKGYEHNDDDLYLNLDFGIERPTKVKLEKSLVNSDERKGMFLDDSSASEKIQEMNSTNSDD